MLTDNDRLELYEALRDQLGERPATLFMTTISPHDPDQAATKGDLQAEIAALRAEMREEFASLYQRVFWTNVGAMIGVAGLVLAAQSVN
jgi:hypothetical protein